MLNINAKTYKILKIALLVLFLTKTTLKNFRNLFHMISISFRFSALKQNYQFFPKSSS